MKRRERKKRRKIKVHLHEGVTIRELSPKRYMIDHRRDGITTRKSYTTLSEAKTASDAIKTRQLNEGILGFSISLDQRRDAERGLLLLDGRTSIDAACRFWLKHHPDNSIGSIQRTMVKRLRLMKQAIDRGDMAALTRRSARTYYRAILKGFWNRPTSSITPDEIKVWCKNLHDFNETTRHNIRGAFLTLLKFHDTGKLAERRKRDDKPPVIFPVNTVKELFAKAAATTPDMLPALTVLFFAGLRPYEMMKLSGGKINVADGHIMVDAETSKTRTARTVDLSDNALAWLRQFPPASRIVPSESTWRTWREKLMNDCEIAEWPVDVARHCFASAHYVLNQNASATAAQLGHFGGLEMFTRHYKSLMTSKDASAYFEIKPAESKVIRFKKSA